MKPLLVLIATFVISASILKFTRGQWDYQLAGSIAMAAMLVFTAIGHFVFIRGMAGIVPSFMPFKKELVLVTGVIEIIFAVALLFPQYQVQVGWLLIAFFILILPANVKASLHQINYQTGQLNGPGTAYLWFRIPLQLFFILWVYFTSIR
ncbi:hypothetical protein [Flagellimonas halotolerans]|uniref:DoxX family protein n=1 Tax=Flagellimonas halotolerans TaxID=3112164 RepID=A0ABU6IL32_9FLAO|nr:MULTISPECIES: hypothetical protein [unclassified Allomuricauda]MEC3963946.1 hypothetical protein [Muricauda sp. SYSU M86414]MEC4263816.1 hypothetical protein [Muricauda sp. SYSU M84420]